MIVSSVNSVNFGRLYRGNTIKKDIVEKNDKVLLTQVNRLEKALRKENLHKTKNVDVILQYREPEGFYGVISNKKQGTPNHPLYRHPLSTDKNQLNNFGKWVLAWDKLYSLRSV